MFLVFLVLVVVSELLFSLGQRIANIKALEKIVVQTFFDTVASGCGFIYGHVVVWCGVVVVMGKKGAEALLLLVPAFDDASDGANECVVVFEETILSVLEEDAVAVFAKASEIMGRFVSENDAGL
jgi:hypothetical protein